MTEQELNEKMLKLLAHVNNRKNIGEEILMARYLFYSAIKSNKQWDSFND